MKIISMKPQNIFKVIKNRGGELQNGDFVKIEGDWDMMIAHPPCTFLAVSGAQWYYDPKDKTKPHPRTQSRLRAEISNSYMLPTKTQKCISGPNPTFALFAGVRVRVQWYAMARRARSNLP